jgi:WXG100 family type VII secretion target
MADKFQAKYDQLDQIAARFANQSQVVQDTIQKVQSSMENLENGGWIGRGSDAFFAEMHGEVMPATRRLQEALDEASRVTREISRLVKQAEQEASSPFRD